MVASLLPMAALPVSALTPEPTPTAVVTATGYDTATLSNVEPGMQYRLGDTGTWVDITGASVNVTNAKATNWQIIKRGDGIATSDSEIQTILVYRNSTPSGVGKTNCTTPANNDGTLTGLVAGDYEYKKSDAAAWTTATAATATGLVNGTYYVRMKASGVTLASDNVTVIIAPFGAMSPEPTPVGGFNALGYDTGMLTNVEVGMQFKINDGDWTTLTSTSQNISGLIGDSDTISVIKRGNGTTTTDSAIQTINIIRHPVPAEPGSTNCTTEANNDGTLTGLTAGAYEYKKSDVAAWTTATAATVTGLTNGTYYVRNKATGSGLASDNLTLIIEPFEAPPVIYNITAGAGGTWALGSATGLSFTCDGTFSEFLSLYIDGNPGPIAIDNYDIVEGSTVLTLKPAYLQTLALGSHTLRMSYIDGYADTTFTIVAKATTPPTTTATTTTTTTSLRKNPQTGVEHMGVTGFELLSALGAAALVFAGKRRVMGK